MWILTPWSLLQGLAADKHSENIKCWTNIRGHHYFLIAIQTHQCLIIKESDHNLNLGF